MRHYIANNIQNVWTVNIYFKNTFHYMYYVRWCFTKLQQVECETWTYNDGEIFDSEKEKGNAFPKLIPNDNIKFNWKRASVLNMRHRHGLIQYANIWLKSCETDEDDNYNISICILNTKYMCIFQLIQLSISNASYYLCGALIIIVVRLNSKYFEMEN